jgi:hypothetical protein
VRSVATRLGLLAGPIGGGAIAMTRMACYGMPPCGDTMNCNGLPDDRPDARAEDAHRDDAADASDAGSDASDASDASSDAADASDASDASDAADASGD